MEAIERLLFEVTKYGQRSTNGLKRDILAEEGITRLRFRK